VGEKLLGPLLYLLTGMTSAVLLLGRRETETREIPAPARLAGIGALAIGCVALATVCLAPELTTRQIAVGVGRTLQPPAVQMARVSVMLVVSAALLSRLSGTYAHAGRAGPVAAIIAAVVVWIAPQIGADLSSRARGECKSALRSLVSSLQAYLAASGGQYPVAETWLESLAAAPQLRNRVRCPVAAKPTHSYALNLALAGLRDDEIQEPSRLVAFFESDAGWNAAGGPELLPAEPRHLGGDNYAFADGHVIWLPRKKLPDGSWAKEPDANYGEPVKWKP
jgi:prepilin-type processing-associated H-X9-DG protein